MAKRRTAAEEKSAAEGLSGLEKAASFLLGIGPDASAEILRHLGDGEIAALRSSLAQAESASPERLDAALSEFHRLIPTVRFVSEGDTEARVIKTPAAKGGKSRDADAINRTPSAALAEALKTELPQTAALVLSRLEPAKASSVLKRLPSRMRSEVARRIAVTDRAGAGDADRVVRALESKLYALAEEGADSDGIRNVAEILREIDSDSEREILEGLADGDPELAEEIRKRSLSLADMADLDAASLRKVMMEAEAGDFAKALTLAGEGLRERILVNAGAASAASIKKDIDFLETLDRPEAEAAAKRILELVRRLELNGGIKKAGKRRVWD